MEYVPQEGVDYIIDLYGVVGVSPDAETSVIQAALRHRLREYHPDRLAGVAPEFQHRGERMTRLLNRAGAVLLNEAHRTEYDGVLAGWEGPISSDGTPVIRRSAALRAEMAMMTPDQVEETFTEQAKRTVEMVGHSPNQQAMLKRLFEASDRTDPEIAEGYDAALFKEDQALAIEEANRGEVLGLPETPRYETTIGYLKAVEQRIGAAEASIKAEFTQRVLGGMSSRLALLAGESPAEPSTAITLTSAGLPHYFDGQASRILEIASRREEILMERLAIFYPNYPIAELQVEAQPNFVVGVEDSSRPGGHLWIGFLYAEAEEELVNISIPAELQDLLKEGRYEEVYAGGFNILTFAPKDQIELRTLLEEACNKHIQKFFPEADH